MQGNGGELALAALRPFGVREMFTLSGGHIFPFLDAAAKTDGFSILDVRHEQTATFAAEGVAKLTRRPGLAVLTAGPGITNGISAITTAHFNGSPLIVFGGRAPENRWGAGSLQELDHVPIVASITKLAETAKSTAGIPDLVERAATTAWSTHRGPVFVDFPLDVVFASAETELYDHVERSGFSPDADLIARAGKLVAAAERPAIIAGSDVWWNGAEEALRHAAEALRCPVFVNGLGRGTLSADHELSFARTRSFLKDADVVVVVGTPLDFRLGFGRFGTAKVIHVVDHEDQRSAHATVEVSPAGDLAEILHGMADTGTAVGVANHQHWIERLRDEENVRRAAAEPELASAATPIHPARVYGELQKALDRDAVIVCDGGDFVSYAGKLIDSYTPGCWLDPGPYGCLGTGLGYAMAARVVHPDRQVVLLLGDGAAGFSLMDVDSLVRHKLPVVMVVGNNGIWGLEKHPMRMLYGYDVAADLQPGCRYDEVVRALGGAGETVTDPGRIGEALQRGFASGVPYLVNVLTDPAVAYPRSSNLA